jgi:tetratricopeptide (TPR) repeat protein
MKTILTAIRVQCTLAIIMCALVVLPTMSGCSKESKSVIQDSQILLSNGKYEEAISMLEQAQRSGGSADSIKTVLTNAHLLYGNFLMYKSDLPHSQKYNKALTEFRSVLVLDSGNQEAKKNKEIIEGILSQAEAPAR